VDHLAISLGIALFAHAVKVMENYDRQDNLKVVITAMTRNLSKL
jgi:hypothetical protein